MGWIVLISPVLAPFHLWLNGKSGAYSITDSSFPTFMPMCFSQCSHSVASSSSVTHCFPSTPEETL